MLPKRQRGQRWQRMSFTVRSFGEVPIVIHRSRLPKLTDGGSPTRGAHFRAGDAQRDYLGIRAREERLIQTRANLFSRRSAETHSIVCDQFAIQVRSIARLAGAKFTLLPRSGSASRTADGEYLFWAEFLFHRKPPCTMVN